MQVNSPPNFTTVFLSEESVFPSHESFEQMLTDNNTLAAIEILKTMSHQELNSLDQNGNGVLHYACLFLNIECLEYLISQKVDLNIPNKLGKTPLYYCLSQKPKNFDQQLACYQLMTAHGAEKKFNIEDGELIFFNLILSMLSSPYTKEGYQMLQDFACNHPMINFNQMHPSGFSLINVILLNHFRAPQEIYPIICMSNPHLDIHEKDSQGYSALDVAKLLNNQSLLSLMNVQVEEKARDNEALFKLLHQFSKKTEDSKTFSTLYLYALYFKFFTPLQELFTELVMNEPGFKIKFGSKTETLFFAAIYLKDIEALHYLVKQGVDIESQDIFGRTPLQVVFSLLDPSLNNAYTLSEVTQMALCLLQYGSNPLKSQSIDNSPFFYCIKHDLDEVFEKILSFCFSYCNDVNDELDQFTHYIGNLFLYCLSLDRPHYFAELILLQEYVTKKPIDLSSITQLNKNSSFLKKVLTFIPPVDENSYIINQILDFGIELNQMYECKPGREIFYLEHVFQFNVSDCILDLLEKYGVRFDVSELTYSKCFHSAVVTGNIKAVKWLFTRFGNEFQVRDCQGHLLYTPLHYATEQQQYMIVEYLIMSGCNQYKIKNVLGKTPLDLAKDLKDDKMIELIKTSISIFEMIELINEKVWKPLHTFLKKYSQPIKMFQPCLYPNKKTVHRITITTQASEKFVSALSELKLEYSKCNPTKEKSKNKTDIYEVNFFPLCDDLSNVLQVFKKHFRRQSRNLRQTYSSIPSTASTNSSSSSQSNQNNSLGGTLPSTPQDDYYLSFIEDKRKAEVMRLKQTHDAWIREYNKNQGDLPSLLQLKSARPDFEEREVAPLAFKQKKHGTVATSKNSKLSTSKKEISPIPKQALSNRSCSPKRKPKPTSRTLQSLLSPSVEVELSVAISVKTNFRTFYQSALNSLKDIKDLITRIEDRANYDIEKSLFERKLVKYTLEYRLLRFTQALLATGKQLSSEDRKLFDSNISLAFNRTQLNKIRNQLRHAECLKHEELIEMGHELAGGDVAASIKTLIASRQGTLEALKPFLFITTLTTLDWDIRFSGEMDEKEKEAEGSQSEKVTHYLKEQFHFLNELFKPFNEDFDAFTKEGDRKDAMKMCILKMAACVNFINPKNSNKILFKEIIHKGNTLAHQIEEIVPYCNIDEIPDGELYTFIKRIDFNLAKFS